MLQFDEPTTMTGLGLQTVSSFVPIAPSTAVESKPSAAVESKAASGSHRRIKVEDVFGAEA